MNSKFFTKNAYLVYTNITQMTAAEKPIKNIIFDLGGVILNIDPALTAHAFNKLGLSDYEGLAQGRPKNLFEQYEMGRCSSEDFRSEIKKWISTNTSTEQIDMAWNAMLLDLPIERLTFLLSLKDKYRLFLLSNTNEIHINRYSQYLNERHGILDLSHIFEKQYYSYTIGMRKPNADIFEFVLAENALLAHETIFIDDSPQHIETAGRLGIHTHHLTKLQTIVDLKF